MSVLELDNPAWRFAVSLYAKPGVSSECLRLQDETGLDVSFALVCLWLGAERGLELDRASLAVLGEVAEAWSVLAVRPLRGVRRDLKTSPLMAYPVVAGLRGQVKVVELEAERVEIALLVDQAEKHISGAARSNGQNAAAANLSLVLARQGRGPDDAPCLAAALAELDGRAQAAPRQER
jgi:uncharacterized protein (TIGR02444 family)